MSLMAAHISSEETVITSSTYFLQISKVYLPIWATATPSANWPTWLRVTRQVGELADLAQGHPPALLQGSLQAVGVARLDADHLDLGTQVLHIGGDPGDQPATAHRHEDGVQLALVLTQYLHGHGTLTGNGVGVIIGVDEHQPLLLHLLLGIGQRLVERIPVQYHLAAPGTHGLDLDLRGGTRHDDGRLDPHVPGGKGQPLSMVARR